ncbi:NAD(P)H-binding protein [Actinophytocola sp.]|jgi:uncharacterized protein YbjT (DUF2867 family)|uniref:NAD(P)H-binding protein n=1 Tax=Actinophytocola sp. TaxID=1872138 RepID=UPI002ED9588F
MTNNTNFLVVGGTGKTGRRVTDRLRARNLPVRAVSRSTEPPFDWSDETTWGPVLDGVDTAYLTFYPDLVLPGAPEIIRAFTTLAVAKGVRRLVLLSGRGEEEAETCERVVQEAGADWTIVRCSWFAQNFSEHFLLPPVLTGEIALPVGSVAEPFVDLDDVADVVVETLTSPGHDGRVYELTGPRLLTFADVAAEISEAAGREVGHRSVTPEEFVAAATALGVPAEEATMLVELFDRVLDGRNAHVSDDIERVLGRPATDFADYAKAAAATGVWTQ